MRRIDKHLPMKHHILFTLFLLVCSLHAEAERTKRHYLSGIDATHTKVWRFRCSDGQNAGRWQSIAVPSCWELQGFGSYTYGRFYKKQGAQPSSEVGEYRTTFTLPRTSAPKCYRMVFEGSMTDTHVFIDGVQVGRVHQGGFTEFSYDITQFVKPGRKQVLEIKVAKESDNASVNSAERRADWWLFGGIYRPVYIEELPQAHIEHATIDARANGDIFLQLVLNDGREVKANLQEKVRLFINDRPVPYDPDRGCFHYAQPQTWDPEHPHLYRARLELKDGQHAVEQNIGFRTMEFRPEDGFYLNGTRLVVKGTNRHCFHPETGRALSTEMSLQDARLIKQMNMNAVRSHYPPDRHFLDICDSIGLLYIDEFPGWQTHYDDTTAQRLLPEFIKRDVNHPCIFVWSNGNEGGWNRTVDPLFAQYDPQHRKVIHPWADYDGIDTHHYPAYQTGTYRMQNGQHVFMPTEFLHGKYDKGQGAALQDMWEHWTRSPLFAGGFIWAFVDEAVRRTDLPTGHSAGLKFGQKGFDIKDCLLDSDGGNGPDGCLNCYRQPEASFFTIREVWSPVYMEQFQVNRSFDGRMLVENRYLFSNLSECTMQYRLKDAEGRLMSQGEVTLPALQPGEKGYARFSVPQDFWKGRILEIEAIRNGESVCSWSAPIRYDQQEDGTLKMTDFLLPANARNRHLSATFSDDGFIQRLTADGQVVPLTQGPMPVGMKVECRKHASRTEKDGTLVNTFWYKGGIDSIQWRQTPDGRLYMDAVVLNDERGHGFSGSFLTDESKWQLGLTFSYPEELVDSVSWQGRGPFRVWKNRLKGQQFGLWSLAFNNTVTGQYNSPQPPLYPEFKGYRSEVLWQEFYAKDTPALCVALGSPHLYARWFTPEEAIDQTPGEMGGLQEGSTPKSEKTMVTFPAGDLSFLLSIPPMQSYKPLDQLGPLSQPDNIRMKSGDEGFHIRLCFY